ncbi:uncharacterized protein CTHT_0063210 [Thermochaetoides thermophila DSM 1495]|uniref:UBR-type domain-containing protein n=1 Tax=Chaetomium thermophilum (strain DSM 1495 / CBS 144.50 / IMI 039719) TaxID=759272 RepID=G0SEC0_CHATD|nr:hypothetical protein CTHT_0063210 [Thermochaetoides thermophila DSM 1495]EGS18297.1 hypothetical protein CTHT_0063210 [Thermochaetoides thermophila DSM 1495]
MAALTTRLRCGLSNALRACRSSQTTRRRLQIVHKRNFTCDCGTTRFPSSAPCNLRINPETGTKGGVHSEEPDANNKYNINFRNLFCGCQVYYDPFKQKGTMFQCLGLGTHETGGCGEDWYHPGCLAGLGPEWYKDLPKDETKTKVKTDDQNGLPTIVEDAGAEQQNGDVVAEAEQGDEAAPEEGEEEDDPPMPPGFPDEDEFEGFICYKCLDAYPWLKRYAGAPGFLAPVYYKPPSEASTNSPEVADIKREELPAAPLSNGNSSSKKRKSSDDPSADDASDSQVMKRPRSEASPLPTPTDSQPTQDPSKATCKLSSLPPAPPGRFSLFFKSDFRAHLCHCPQCFPLLTPHPHLLEEEETYEPPLSSDGGDPTNPQGGTSSGGSLYDRGESALRTIDRVRAIEGVMAYQHLKDKLMPFFEEFARSGKVVSAEDVKAYFAKLRGDEEKERMARVGAERSRDGQGEGDNQREQSGY